MDEALQTAEMVVVVLSQAYLESYYCKAELSAAFAGTDKRLIPVRVDDFKVRGLWAPINYIDLVGTSDAQRINLGLPGDNSEMVFAKVSNWMRENQQWVFIFDNIKDEKTLEKYCSFSVMEGQHILVTSRNRRFSRCVLFEPSVFTENEANEFIEKYTGKSADGYFKELAQRMGYLPLALDLCGAYMKIHGCSYQKYLTWFQKYNLELLTASDENADKKNLKTTWQISFKEIENSASE